MAIDGIGLQEPSTITKSLAAIPITRNSSVTYQEVMVIGDPDSTTSSAVAKVTNAAAASTAWGLVTRPVGPITVVQSTASDLLVNVSSVAGAVNIRSSAANALVTVYQSTATDLNVTVANLSTTVNVSSLAGAVNIRSSAANALVTVYQSTASDFVANISSVSGQVATRPASTVWASSAGFHFDSSGALQVTGATASTVVTVSRAVGNSSAADFMPVRLVVVDSSNTPIFASPAIDYVHGSALTASTVQGPAVMLRASSTTPGPVSTSDMFVTQWGTLNGAAVNTIVTSSGASVMDSTESAIKVNVVAGAAGGSTVMTVSTGSVRVHQSTATDLLARVNQGVGNSSAGDRWRVNVANSSAADFIGMRVVDSSGTGFHGPASPMPVHVRTDSGASVMDSTEGAIKVNVVAGAAGGSTLVTVRQSTVGDLRAAVYQSTAADLNVTVAGYSTTVNVSSLAGAVNMRSSAANALVTVYQSTAADLNVTVAGYSTTVNVSSLAGAVIMRSSAASALVSVYQSTAADLNAVVTLASTGNTILARLTTSSGGALEGSTTAPAHGVLGLHVRQVPSTMQSTTVTVLSSNSTAVYPLISSVAGLMHKVYAVYCGASTSGNMSTIVFMSSLAIDRWAYVLSSGYGGANLAVTPPSFIFRTDAANALNVRIESASTAITARISLAWMTEA